MKITLEQLVDALQDVGIAFRHDHPSAVHQGAEGIFYGFTNPDIDLTDRLRAAVDKINAQ